MSPVVLWILKLLGLAVAAGGVFIAHKKYNAPADNIVEEFVEEEIKDQTGLTVDLSPDTPDKDEPSK